VVVGLLDTNFDQQQTDLLGADIVVRDFVGSLQSGPELMQHGTHSVTTIVGQGHRYIRGIAPRVRLLVGTVVNPNAVARPQALANGILWLIEEGAQLVAMPLGGTVDYMVVREQIRKGTRRGVIFFAARGSGWSKRALFPARDPTTIAVGAADEDGSVWFDIKKASRLDLLAPGWNVSAPISRRAVAEMSGSSVACVVAVGAAALAASAGMFASGPLNRKGVLAVLRNRVS